MRIGIVGCGKIGTTYARCLVELGETVTAVSDVDLARASSVASSCSSRAYADFREMLERESPDLVCVTTPTASHATAVAGALRAGAHVLCEKPLAMSLEEARVLVDLAARVNKILSVGFKFRFEAAHALVKEQVASGILGRPQHLMLTYFQPLPDRSWYLEEGVTANLLIHVFDLVRWYFLDEPLALRAQAQHRFGHPGEDYALVEILLPEAGRAVVAAGYFPDFPGIAGSEDMVFQLAGAQGYVICKRPDLVVLRVQTGTQTFRVRPVDAFREELWRFCHTCEEAAP